MNIINIKELLEKQFVGNKFARYDIILRYVFIEKYYKSNKLDDFKYKPYNKLLKIRNRDYDAKKFIKIINSFEEYKYKDKYPIVLDSNNIIRNGGHRLACCLWFGIKDIPYRVNEKKKGKRIFTKKWMINNGFSKYMKDLDKMKKDIFIKIGI